MQTLFTKEIGEGTSLSSLYPSGTLKKGKKASDLSSKEIAEIKAEQEKISLANQGENINIGVDVVVEKSRSMHNYASSNVMARNFFNSSYEHSNYVQNAIDTKRLGASQSNQLHSLLGSLMAQASLWEVQRNSDSKYINGIRLSIHAKMGTKRIEDQENRKEAEKYLKKSKEELDKKAEELLTLTDEDGNAIEIKEEGTVTIKNEEGSVITNNALAGTPSTPAVNRETGSGAAPSLSTNPEVTIGTSAVSSSVATNYQHINIKV